jgi:8-oxo-dGTP diphosphatase
MVHCWAILFFPKEDLDAAAYRILKQRTGLSDAYLEQVHTFLVISLTVGIQPGRVVTVNSIVH